MVPEISVIIPVYNAEAYLSKCVDSVIQQTEKKIEVILVDDGSKDGSSAVCDAYAKEYTNIRTIHQENAGVSAARNAGISVSSGNYIGFVDSDDWIKPDMYERMLAEARHTDADIVMCDAVTVYSNGKTALDTITQLPESTILTRAQITPPILLEVAGSACRCIYRYNDKRTKPCWLRFPLGVKFSEDRIFNLYAMGYASRIRYIKEPYYNRFVNIESAVHRFHPDYFEAYKIAAYEIERAIRLAWNDDKYLQKAYLSQFIAGAEMAICNYFYKTSTLSHKEKRKRIAELCDDEQLREAIKRYGSDRKSQWIIDKEYNWLILYAKLANWKHRR